MVKTSHGCSKNKVHGVFHFFFRNLKNNIWFLEALQPKNKHLHLEIRLQYLHLFSFTPHINFTIAIFHSFNHGLMTHFSSMKTTMKRLLLPSRKEHAIAKDRRFHPLFAISPSLLQPGSPILAQHPSFPIPS